jgi:hypothetical protein
MRKGQNIFTTILAFLNVKHTVFSNKYFNEHPHKYNLYGLSKMLSEYGIQNAGIKIKEKEKDIFNIQTPFVAHMGGNFVLVYQVDHNIGTPVKPCV